MPSITGSGAGGGGHHGDARYGPDRRSRIGEGHSKDRGKDRRGRRRGVIVKAAAAVMI
jgi:hypothetical protein